MLITDRGFTISGADEALGAQATAEGPTLPCDGVRCAEPASDPYDDLTALLGAVRAARPDDQRVTPVPEDRIPYEVLVHTLDAAREAPAADGGGRRLLFPAAASPSGALQAAPWSLAKGGRFDYRRTLRARSALEPLTLSLSLLVIALTALGGWRARGYADKTHLRALETEREKLVRERRLMEGELRAMETNRNYYKRRLGHAQGDLERVEEDREFYRRIAKSRELRWVDGPPDPQTTPLWVQRRYANHPRENLAALSQDIADLEAERIRVKMWLVPQGGWTRLTPELGPLIWEGPRERVLEEIRVALTDADHPFMKTEVSRDETRKEWADPDSPALFLIDLESLEPPESPIRLHEIEVVRVETQIEERIIEQPVVIEIPVNPAGADQVYLTRDDVMALFEVELDTKLAEFGMRRAPQTAQREGVEIEPGPELERRRAERDRAIQERLEAERDREQASRDQRAREQAEATARVKRAEAARAKKKSG